MPTEFNPNEISLVIGIGNPGIEYEHTFHNAGKLVVQTMLGSQKITAPHSSFKYGKEHNRVYALSETFVNESGIAVHNGLSYFKYEPNQLLVVHDDADLLIGETKLQFGRGDAGHNGIKSIIQHMGTESFWRFRIGIRKPVESPNHIKAETFVLKKMSQEDIEIFKSIGQQLETILEKNP